MKANRDGFSKSLIILNSAVRIYCAFYMIISDCDETFNYWEPLNLLVRGFGKETWEYSPEYAIRSYAYLLPYYLVAYPLNLLGQKFQFPPHYVFYMVRLIALCGFTAYTEVNLHDSLSLDYSPKVGKMFLFLSSIAPGMSHASGALLPSTFGMNCLTMASANVLSAMKSDDQFVNKSVNAFSWFILGGIIGWPFTLALAIPFGLFTIYKIFERPVKLLPIFCNTLKNGVIIVLISTAIDSFFYKKIDMVPLNIVLYNVFGGEGEGPEIFGVEPFSYYVLNLLVNFNVVFILAYLGVFLNIFIANYPSKVFFGITFPILVWSIIFGSQPHKEERFLYPIYPLLLASASVFTCKVFGHFSLIASKVTKGTISSTLIRKTAYVLFGALVGLVSILRVINLVANYSAPLETYSSISHLPETDQVVNVCTGREWYHFPNSFFLPKNYRLRFVQSGFDGLLPGDFKEGEGIISATSSIPPDMNNKNQFSAMKLMDFHECSYYIDNTEPTLDSEPNMFESVNDSWEVVKDWEVLKCNKIINPSATHRGVGRLIWIPHFLRRFFIYDVQQMEFCSFQRKDTQPYF